LRREREERRLSAESNCVCVFISHSSKDKPAVLALAEALCAHGIDPWFDDWEIGAGDDIVAKINEGLDAADAGIIVFSRHSRESRWVDAEVSTLTYELIQGGKALIPVMAGEDAYVPPLLRPRARRDISEVDAIADAVLGRKPQGKPPVAPEQGRVEPVLLSLRRDPAGGIVVGLEMAGTIHRAEPRAELPRGLIEAQQQFLAGFRTGLRRDPVAAERQSLDASLAGLGRALREVCLGGGAGAALAGLVDGAAVGTVVEVTVEADDPALLGLPFEALRLPDDRVLALDPRVTLRRRPLGLDAPKQAKLAGPLKILVAIGAPDEGQSGGAVLDQERELQTILDAVDLARAHETVQVRFLEIGHPEEIGKAIKEDAYHVLHISCHGLPGLLELEDQDGKAVRVGAEALLEPIRRTGRPLPLILLNACQTGVAAGQTASLAEALLRAGVPAVLAMQASVSDGYATRFAGAFYRHLARRETLLPSRALADARKELEKERQTAIGRGAPLAETQPEFATPSLFGAGVEQPIADFAAELEKLARKPVHEVAGQVPQLRPDDLIGRRRELRQTLAALRDPGRDTAGVALIGMGGTGKSALAGRAMARLAETGWMLAQQVGRFDLARIVQSVVVALLQAGTEDCRGRAALLGREDQNDQVRLQLLGAALAEQRILLVLDDFEQNLTVGGAAFLDEDIVLHLRFLAGQARRGRLLITSRYPLPGLAALFRAIPIGPLSAAETRKLLLRLPGLAERASAETALVLRAIGGHPRMLEIVDALLRSGQGRLVAVTEKLRILAEREGIDLAAPGDAIDDTIQAALQLGARDILLKELLDIAVSRGISDILLQAAVSNLPVTPAGLARMLERDALRDLSGITASVGALAGLSLLHRFADGGVWVHRWTAESLAEMQDPDEYRARCIRAGRYRMWRVEHESQDLEDAVEAMRNFLAGQDFDSGAEVAKACLGALRRFGQTIGIAALAAETLETLPETHGGYSFIADQEAMAHLALGLSGQALSRYQQLLARHERLARAEPDRADYQRDLSGSSIKMGDLYSALGQGEEARQAYLKFLAIAERLAQADPDRADYQRDLSVSLNKMGDLYRALGQGEEARQAFLKALAIRERLAQAEPDRADYQRDLSVSLENMGDLYRALGQGEEARQAYLKSLAIAERLAQAEPDRADYQRDLSVSYIKMGDLYRALGQGEEARQAFLKSLAIAERLAQAEPDRADYQRDLSVSYERMGDLYSALGQGEEARQAFLKSLAIRERLAQAEPDRADYQRDLSVSLNKMGDLYSALGQGEEARQAYLKDLAIAERLAQAEPDRADYQRDLVISLVRMGSIKGGDDGRADLVRAAALLGALKAAGKLAPADEGMIGWVAGLVDNQGQGGARGTRPRSTYVRSLLNFFGRRRRKHPEGDAPK
jgi:tetratricopeptide (TPR) repeat protein